MLHSPFGCHILNKTNYLVDIYNPAEVRDNGAPCLLRQIHAFSLQQAANWPSPASAEEECTPIPQRFLTLPDHSGEPSPWEYPGITFLARTITFMLLLGKLQWLILYSRSSTVGFFFFLLMFWSAKMWAVYLTMCNAWRTDGLFSSARWHGKNEILSIKLQSVTFYLKWGFLAATLPPTHQLHCISLRIRYDFRQTWQPEASSLRCFTVCCFTCSETALVLEGWLV